MSEDEDVQEAPEEEQSDEGDAEAPDTQEEPEAPVGATEATTEQSGKKFVEFEDPAVAARFKHIYGNMKEYERQVGVMAADNRKLLDKLDNLSEAQAKAEVASRVVDLNALKKVAMDEADNDRVIAIDDELRKLGNVEVKATPTPMPAAAPTDENPLTPEQMAAISSWGQEMDAQGNYKRPWAQPSHPLHQKAAGISAAVLNDPFTVEGGVDACLKEIDRLMGTDQPTRNTASVISGGNERPKKQSGGGLSKDQKAVAQAIYRDMPAAEAHKRYITGLGNVTK